MTKTYSASVLMLSKVSNFRGIKNFDIPVLFSRFAPDWVLQKDKLKDIVDPLKAIQMVAETLSIAL